MTSPTTKFTSVATRGWPRGGRHPAVDPDLDRACCTGGQRQQQEGERHGPLGVPTARTHPDSDDGQERRDHPPCGHRNAPTGAQPDLVDEQAGTGRPGDRRHGEERDPEDGDGGALPGDVDRAADAAGERPPRQPWPDETGQRAERLPRDAVGRRR